MEALHVHIGPGGLGLGLIVDTANEAELESHLVGRKDSPATVGRYRLELTGEEARPLRTSSYSEATCFEELCPAAQAAIAQAESMLITTAVGRGLEACGDLIVEIASQRGREDSGRTVFIACENNPGECYPKLAARLEELGVECRATMVNRLCPGRRLEEETMTLVVPADPHAEWLIEGEEEGAILRRIGSTEAVSFVPEVEPFAVRKLWLVNGIHIALALFAREKKEPSIRAAAREPERLQALIELQADMIQALRKQWSEVLGDNGAYGRRQLAPFWQTHDDTRRILKRLKRADLAPFLRDADRKLGEPARRYVAVVGHASFNFESIFELLHKLLLNFASYEDEIEILDGEVGLDRGRDRNAVDAYGELLRGRRAAGRKGSTDGRAAAQVRPSPFGEGNALTLGWLSGRGGPGPRGRGSWRASERGRRPRPGPCCRG